VYRRGAQTNEYDDEVKQGSVYGCTEDGSPKALNKLTGEKKTNMKTMR